MAMILLPGFVPLMISTHGLNLSFINWFFLPVTLLTLVIFWKAFNGYTVYGATDQSFRKSLLSSLDQSNLKYTEDMTGIHLSSYDITLKATFMMGSGQLRIKGKDPEKVIEKILPILKKELEKPGVDLKPFLFYFGMAVIFLVFGFVELSLFQKIGNY
jgi:hypothetical protein